MPAAWVDGRHPDSQREGTTVRRFPDNRSDQHSFHRYDQCGLQSDFGRNWKPHDTFPAARGSVSTRRSRPGIPLNASGCAFAVWRPLG